MHCLICKCKINQDDKKLLCCDCQEFHHLKCVSTVTDKDYDLMINATVNTWKCSGCLKKKSIPGDHDPLAETTTSGSEWSESEVGAKRKVLCQICNKGFSHNAYRATCTKCSSDFHLKCIKIGKDDYAKLKSWNCYNCFNPDLRGGIKSSVGDISLSDVIAEMRNFRKEMIDANKEMTQSMNTYSSWIADNSEQIKQVGESVKSIVQQLEELRQENLNLKKDNKMLTTRLNVLEQSMKENIVEIQGVPFRKDENIINLLKKISTVIGFDFKDEMIDNYFRYKFAGMDPAKPTGIVVRFLRKQDKMTFMSRRRERRNLNSRDLGFNEGDATVIYINDSLTKERRTLLKMAREVKNAKNYTYLWVKNGRIYVRKNEGDRFIIIDSKEDLDKLA